MYLEQGAILAVLFKSDDYLGFINHCFSNVLISGVQVKFKDMDAILFITIAAPGIDRIVSAIKEFKGISILD